MVWREVVVAGHDRQGAQEVRTAAWVRRRAAPPRPPALTSFDAGEAEAIALALGLRPALEEQAAPQPWGTSTQPLRLARADEAPPWRSEELATGHWPMLSAPTELASLLHRIGADG